MSKQRVSPARALSPDTPAPAPTPRLLLSLNGRSGHSARGGQFPCRRSCWTFTRQPQQGALVIPSAMSSGAGSSQRGRDMGATLGIDGHDKVLATAGGNGRAAASGDEGPQPVTLARE